MRASTALICASRSLTSSMRSLSALAATTTSSVEELRVELPAESWLRSRTRLSLSLLSSQSATRSHALMKSPSCRASRLLVPTP